MLDLKKSLRRMIAAGMLILGMLGTTFAAQEAADHEAFDSLLAAASKKITSEKAAIDSVVPLFNEPQTQRGRSVTLEGIARSVMQVNVGDTHYYQIGLFTADSQQNPLIVCVPWLPVGMPSGNGPDYHEALRVTGVFLKKWAYQTAGAVTLQTAPLLVGAKPIRLSLSPSARNDWASWIAGGIIAAIVLWLIVTICLQQIDSRRMLITIKE